jgi:hypothetical protein
MARPEINNMCDEELLLKNGITNFYHSCIPFIRSSFDRQDASPLLDAVQHTGQSSGIPWVVFGSALHRHISSLLLDPMTPSYFLVSFILCHRGTSNCTCHCLGPLKLAAPLKPLLASSAKSSPCGYIRTIAMT